MNEHDWLTSEDPLLMLGYLCDRVSGRKLRLLACACSRAGWEGIAPAGRQIVTVAEAVAEGEKTLQTLAMQYASPEVVLSWVENAGAWTRSFLDWSLRMHRVELQALIGLVRDVFGNPFRPLVVDPAWLTPTVV